MTASSIQFWAGLYVLLHVTGVALILTGRL